MGMSIVLFNFWFSHFWLTVSTGKYISDANLFSLKSLDSLIEYLREVTSTEDKLQTAISDENLELGLKMDI